MCSDKTMKISDASSSWTVSIYNNDIYEHLKILEQQRLPYQRRSPQLQYRCGLVIYLKELIDKVSFCRVTLHLAVFLLDFFMDSHSVKPEKLTLIAFTCLVLAGKFEEHERKVPTICDMNEYLNSDYIQKDIIYLEHKILKYFNWKLNMPTAVHFAEYFLNFALIPNDFLCKNCSSRFNHYNLMKHCLDSFVDRSLEDDLLISYPPSFVAASCLLAVRITMDLDPVWPDQLEEVTTYSESDLKICSARILGYDDLTLEVIDDLQRNAIICIDSCREECQKKRKRKLELSPDQGYETEKGCCVTPKAKKE